MTTFVEEKVETGETRATAITVIRTNNFFIFWGLLVPFEGVHLNEEKDTSSGGFVYLSIHRAAVIRHQGITAIR